MKWSRMAVAVAWDGAAPESAASCSEFPVCVASESFRAAVSVTWVVLSLSGLGLRVIFPVIPLQAKGGDEVVLPLRMLATAEE